LENEGRNWLDAVSAPGVWRGIAGVMRPELDDVGESYGKGKESTHDPAAKGKESQERKLAKLGREEEARF
jgi:hypothetical protein